MNYNLLFTNGALLPLYRMGGRVIFMELPMNPQLEMNIGPSKARIER